MGNNIGTELKGGQKFDGLITSIDIVSSTNNEKVLVNIICDVSTMMFI